MNIEHSKEYRLIANRIIRERASEFEIIKDYGIKIAYLVSDEEKRKNRKIVCADCTQVPEKWKWCCKYDFLITVYEPNVETFTEEQKEILMLHELKHVGVVETGNVPKYYVVPHDVEEFYSIIREYGINWDTSEQGGVHDWQILAE